MSFLVGNGGKSTFDRLLESATSQVNLEINWATNLEICDSIRQNDVTPKYAVAAIQKKVKDPNPRVCKFALIVLEACVKNCGQSFHEEIATHDFMDDIRTLAQTGSAPVKEQVLAMLQAWNHAFRNKTQFQPILATYNLMKMEGYSFPPLSESDAMFSSDAAPSWKDGDVCHMCRVKFGTFTRQHHCRSCGEVFCSKCSSKTSIIPKLGLEREVRVCDPCYDEVNPNDRKLLTEGATLRSSSELPVEYLTSALAKEEQTKPKLSAAEVKAQEEEEMQLALALSLSEEESSKNPSKNWSASSSMYAQPKAEPVVEPRRVEPKSTLFSHATESLRSVNDSENPELSKYLDRSYWERKSADNSREPSAPSAQENSHRIEEAVNSYATDSDTEEETVNSDAFIQTMEKSIEMFVNRMNNVRMKGKHIAMDSTVQSLFQSLNVMHPQLMKLLEDEEDAKAKYEAMLQKLSVIREARESLNDMRAQYQEKTRQQELEQEMLRRMQMEQKLELMRQQKQEYLEYQRQLQVQRQQDLDEYQQEKLRQRQVPGMQSSYADYPVGEMPIHHMDAYQLIGPNPPYGDLPDYPSRQQNMSTIMSQQQVIQDGYQIDRPPQYPGAEPDVCPPSYALAMNKVFQSQHGNKQQLSMSQQQHMSPQQQQMFLAQQTISQQQQPPPQHQEAPPQQQSHSQTQPLPQLPHQQQEQHLSQHQQTHNQQLGAHAQYKPQSPYQQQTAVQPQQSPLPLQHQLSQQQLPVQQQPTQLQPPALQQQQPPPQQQMPPPQQQLPSLQQHLPLQQQHLPPQQQPASQYQHPQQHITPQQPHDQQQQPPQNQQLSQQQLPYQQQPAQQQSQQHDPNYQQYPAQQQLPQQDFSHQQYASPQHHQNYQPQQMPQNVNSSQYPPPPNYQQSYPTNQRLPMEELSGNMKDLQLISFD